MTALRRNLTPFLKAVMKALSCELEALINRALINRETIEKIIDEIIQHVPAENTTLNFCTNLSQVSSTLQLEFDQLLNLQ